MTFMRREMTCGDEIVSEARSKMREKDFTAVIDLMSHALCTRPQHADFYWFRAFAKWQQGRLWDDPDWYKSALNDLQYSVDLDPSPIVAALEYPREYLPQHWWALPAYKKILEVNSDLRIRHKVEFARSRSEDDIPAKNVAEIIPCEIQVITEWLQEYNLFDNFVLDSEIKDAISKYALLSDIELSTCLGDSDTFIRAVSLSILATRGAITPGVLLRAMSDRHRSMRAVAIRAIGLFLAQNGQSDTHLECSLIDKVTKDKSYLCRKAAVETINVWARSIQSTPTALEHIWQRCKAPLAAALEDSQRQVVIASIQTLITFGQFASILLSRVEATTVATYKGESDPSAQLAIARCVFALSTQSAESSRTQHWQTVRSLIGARDCYLREKAVSTVQSITKLAPSLAAEIRPSLRELSWMDDSKTVRETAQLALKELSSKHG